MTIAAYAFIFFSALARCSVTINSSNCQESTCPDGFSCVDANNEVCNSEKILNCQCKPVHGRGLIVTCYDRNRRPPAFSVPIAQDGAPSQDTIWSHSFPSDVYFDSVDLDNVLQQAYFYDSTAKTIKMNNNYYIGNSTDEVWTTLHKGLSRAYVRLAVDWVSHNIYWTDPTFMWIMVQSLLGDDTSMFRVLIHENLEGPVALALDPLEDLLFWSDIGTFTKIEVSSLSGRNRRTLLCYNLEQPNSLAADYEDQRLYFVDRFRHTVETVTYEGTDRKVLLAKHFSMPVDIAIYKDYLYVADEFFLHRLSFINKTNGNELSKNIEFEKQRYTGLAVFHYDIQPSSVKALCENYGCEHICLTEKNGAICICKDGYNLNQDMKTCSLYTKYFHRALVYSNESSICTVDIRVFSDFIFDPVCVLETSGTKYMVLDTDWGHIFIGTDTAIYWARVDNPELHQLPRVSGIITGLAWDGYDRNLYWTEVDTGKILRMSIESNQTQVFKEGLTKPRDILILPHERLVYWISEGNGSRLESSNINGIDMHVVLNYDDYLQWKSLSDDDDEIPPPGDDLQWKSLSYDQDVKRIYIIVTSSRDESRVISCNLDGSNIKSFVLSEIVVERLEIFKGYLMVTAKHSEGTVMRSYSIGHIRNGPIASGVFHGNISDIKVFDENNRQNETGPCFFSNGECDQICIANQMSRICKCTFGFTLAGDGKTCISDPFEDNFMLVYDVTHENNYQISMDDQSVQGIKAKGINTMYNPFHDLVLWTTEVGDTIFSMHFNGTGKKQFPVSRQVRIFDVDYSTGNLYYASNNLLGTESYVSVLSPDGKHLDLLKRRKIIHGLVVHPSEGYMFLLHRQSLVRATMDGSRLEILREMIYAEGGLTIDYKNGYLYWIEHGDTVGGYNIECYKPDGTNHTLIEFNKTFLNEYRPSDLAVYEDYLFIAYNKQSRLMKLNISMPNEITEFSVPGELGNIHNVNIYSSQAQKKNAFCSDDNGCCSTFCLPVPDGGVCGCEDGVVLMEGSTSICSNIPLVTVGL